MSGEHAQFSRREVLRTGAIAAGALLLGGPGADLLRGLVESGPHADTEALLSDFEAMKHNLGRRRFEPGDTIPGPVVVDVPSQGWTLTAHAQAAQDKIHGSDLLLEARAPNTLANAYDSLGVISNDIIIGGADTTKQPNQGLQRWRVRPVTTQEVADNKGQPDRAPADAIQFYVSSPLELSSAPAHDSKNIAIFAPYRVAWFEGSRRSTDLVDRRQNRVVSEMPIDETEYSHLDEIVSYYQSFMTKRSPIIVIQQDTSMNGNLASHPSLFTEVGDYDAYDDVLDVSRGFLRSRYAGIVLPHEFSHALFFDFKDHKQNQALTKQFNSVFGRYVNGKLWKTDKHALGTCNPDYSAVLAMFDESTYTDLACQIGHPEDSADELFASGLNCMRQFERPLLERFASLSAQDKQVAGEIIGLITKITDQMAVQAKSSRSLIPQDSPLRSV